MIYITDAAQEHFASLLTAQKPGTQIRVSIINPGTSNSECSVSYYPPEAVEPTDIELKFKKISAYVDTVSAPYLKDAVIDFIKDKFGSQLTIKAPNANTDLTNNDLSLTERVQYLIQSQINPQLKNHGGKVILLKITSDMLAILQFSGGCNGCSMVNYTLKEAIERKLLENFPELKGVCDITDHQHGEHSYY